MSERTRHERVSRPAARPMARAAAMLATTALMAATLALPTPLRAQGMPPAAVVTAEVTRGEVREDVTLAGTVRAIRDSLIAAEVEGRVLARHIENGTWVEKDTVMIELDRARLQRALARAEAELAEVAARLERASRQARRAETLHEEEVLSSNLLDEAVAEKRAQTSRKESVEAQIAAIKDDLERSMIRAPFAGTVTEIHTEVGEWLRQGDPVARLADFDTIEITVDLPERYYPHVEKDDAASATLDALPGLTLEARVFAVVPQAGSAARTFPLQVRAPNPGRRVGAGMLARVHLVVSSEEEVLQVPRDALVRGPRGESVYRVRDDDTVEQVPVTSGRSLGTQVEISGDLASGDRIVVRGNERLMPGQKVVDNGSGGPREAEGAAPPQRPEGSATAAAGDR